VKLLRRIQETIESHALFPKGKQIVVGVSGGADSVALTQILFQLNIPFTIAHLNHNLRGAASDADEKLVRDLATRLSVPIVVEQAEIIQNGASLEMEARKARHLFFSTFTNAVIVLAHHADDQVETFLLRLARGAGTEGLCGMKFSQKIGSLHLVRPLLECTHSELVEWLTQNKTPWREDQSNTDKTILRNKIRHTILPLLEQELNPNIRNNILRTMNILRAENEWMNEQLLATSTTTPLPLALHRRHLRNWLFEQELPSVGFETIEQIIALQNKAQGTAFVELDRTHRLVIEYGKLRIEKNTKSTPSPTWELKTTNGTGWKKDHGKGAGILPAEASISATKVGSKILTVRTLQPGDRFAPLGMKHARKLQDIFTDLKIPRTRRTTIPLIFCDEEMIWIPGYRIAEGWQIQSPQAPAIHLHLSNKTTDNPT